MMMPEKQQQEQEALFAAKHAELVSEARDVARELGVTVRTVAFRPDGTAVADDFVAGVDLQQQVQATVARKVSAMGQREVAAHRRQLQMLRSAVVREMLQTKRAPGQQESDGEVVVLVAIGQQGGGTVHREQQDHQ